MSPKLKKIGVLAFGAISGVSCQVPVSVPWAEVFFPKKENAGEESQAPAQRSDEQLQSLAAKKAKIHAEVFRELYGVVLLSEPKDRGEFGGWVDTLNQGASLEGVYHGLVQSEAYRRLETRAPAASPEALQVFREELNALHRELEVHPPTENYGLLSVYGLKRVLSEAALQVIAEKKKVSPEKLCTWYAQWVVRLAQKKIDFGLPQRNQPDEAFHYQWAMQMLRADLSPAVATSSAWGHTPQASAQGLSPSALVSPSPSSSPVSAFGLALNDDRIVGEVLNRVHRLLNPFAH
ncbi:MAG: hypothetical protein ACO3A2_01185 [Bdellovibrionia bacterium]